MAVQKKLHTQKHHSNMGIRGVLSPMIQWLLLMGLCSSSRASSCEDLSCESKEKLLQVVHDLQQKLKKLDALTASTCPPCTVCHLSPCQNGGKCWLSPSEANEYLCACPDDFSGDNCEEKVTCTEDSCGVDDECYVANHRTNCVCKRKPSSKTLLPTSPPTTTFVPTTSTKKPVPPGHCDGKGHYYNETDACYEVFTNADFAGAQKTCETLGGHLASVHSSEENQFLGEISRTGRSGGWLQQVWIGLHKSDYESKGEWVWTDGTPFDWHNWAPELPNNSYGIEHCGQLLADNKDKSWVNTWNDIRCSDTLRAFICKTKALH